MKNLTDKLVINKIEWTNNESDMHILCTVINGFFHYNTTLVMPGFELNRVISELQKQNCDVDIQDCLQIEQWSEDTFGYVFNLSNLVDSEFVFYNESLKDNLKQIRA